MKSIILTLFAICLLSGCELDLKGVEWKVTEIKLKDGTNCAVLATDSYHVNMGSISCNWKK